jgi:hypothetical protein
MHVCMYVCVTSILGSAYILDICTYIHTYIHTHIHTYIHTYSIDDDAFQSAARPHSTGSVHSFGGSSMSGSLEWMV